MTARIEIKGLGKLIKKINKLEKMDAVKAALKNAATMLAGEMAEYPPETAANRPPTPFWIRGRGLQTASGNLYNSGNIANSWEKAKPTIRNKGFTVAIGSNVSYVRFVQSDDDQAMAMKKIGWQTDQQVLDDNKDEVKAELADAINKIINS